MIVRLILTFLFVASSYWGFSANPSPRDSTAEKMYQEFSNSFHSLYVFDFQKADSLVQIFCKKYPEKPMSKFLKASYYWWLIASGEDSEQLIADFEKALLDCRSSFAKTHIDELTDEQLFLSIISYAYRARLELHELNYLKAALYLDDCVHYIKRSFGKESRYEIFYLTSGLYNFFIAYSLKKYPVMYPYLIVAPRGNKELGIIQLTSASKSKNVFLSTEGTYFLFKIYLEMEPNADKAMTYANLLCAEYPSNLLYQFLRLKACLLADNLAEAKKQLELLHVKSILNKSLTEMQKNFFLTKAQKEMKEYYSENPTN